VTTSTPQNAYQDTGLSILQTNPILCDSTGRLPQWFVADGAIKLRLTDKNGVQIFVGDNLLVVGPSSGGGGGGGSVDPTTILQTGDIKAVYGTGVLSGFVRANGRTIGSATSGATERANADTQALFVYLWVADANLAVSGGRGASAAADFAANKTIALPDLRGRVIAGLDGMGSSLAGRIGSGAGSFGVNNDTLGKAGGAEVHTIVTANLPPYTPSGTISGGTITFPSVAVASSAGGGNSITLGPNSNRSDQTSTLLPSQPPITFTGAAQGGTSTAFDTTQPTMLMTYYVKI
jgi:microcystin-dependent protein